MALTSSVQFKELLNRRMERGKWYGPASFERTYLLAWVDRWQFLRDVFGTTELRGEPPTPFRVTPQPYPDEGITGVFATDFRIEGKGKALKDESGNGSWELAAVTILFTVPGSDTGSGGGMTDKSESLQMSTNIIPISSAAFTFESDSKPILHDVPRFVGQTRVQITKYRVPYLPIQAIESMVGCVNSTEFEGRPPETMLFLGANPSRETNRGEIPVWTITYEFLRRSINHQFLPRPDTGEFERVVPDIYPTADLNLLP